MMLEFNWIYEGKDTMIVRDYIKKIGLPRRFIKSVKYEGGQILINQQEVSVRYPLTEGDQLTIIPPVESGHDTVLPSQHSIDIVYEDRDILVLNKPAACVSIPSRLHPDKSMANRIKGYYDRQGYHNQVIHIVTRLDRDTTGLMLVAKHRLAHALLDQQIQDKGIQRYYYGISHRLDWPQHGLIEAPIGRDPRSIILRQVIDTGDYALTEYWLEKILKRSSLLKFQIHTGRTHQIRVHVAHLGGPLIGDDLYGGDRGLLYRPALHCCELKLQHPFTQEGLHFQQSMPSDMLNWINLNESED